MEKRIVKNISKDFILNIAASFILTGTVQLIVYPRLANLLGSEEYGLMLTVMGVVNVVALSFGSNLAYVRLIQQKEYDKENKCGDFQVIVALLGVLSVLIVSAVLIFLKLPLKRIAEVVVTTVLTVFINYYIVTFRIKLNYKKNLIANVVMGCGYAAAVLVLHKLPWPHLFSIASILGLIYIWRSSNIMREPFLRTERFKIVLKSALILIISGLMGNITTYLDRFLLYPIMGGDSVSTYTTASFFAKTMALVMAPISGVVLSYLTASEIWLNRKKYFTVNAAFGLFGAAYLVMSVTIGRYITGWLYPTLIEQSRQYIFLASLGVIIGTVNAFNGAVIMAFAPLYWQIINQIVKVAVYFMTGIFLIRQSGIQGLCISLIITNMVATAFSYFVGDRYLVKRAEKQQ